MASLRSIGNQFHSISLRRQQWISSIPTLRNFSLGQSSSEELKMENSLRVALEATHVCVTDVSGGCGSMYRIEVESPQFQGKGMVQQHRMVNEVLKKEIGQMHGLTLKTKVSQGNK